MNIRTSLLVAAALAMAPLGSARAAPPSDPSWTFSSQWENDSLNPFSDRYYTNGMRFGLTSPTDQLPDFLRQTGHFLLGEGQQRYALDLEQLMFTPTDIGSPRPSPQDRPYAGILMGSLSLIQDTDTTRSVLGLGLGVIGPVALGREVQSAWHHLIDARPPRGWGSQPSSQPVVQLTAERTWRTPALNFGGLQFDALPSISVGAGTFRIYAQAGAQVRVGQGLDADFGTPRIRPGLTGTDAYVQTIPFVWYFFAGADGQAIAWDETLDGEPFTSSRHVTRIPLVGEMQAGFAVMWHGVRFAVTQVAQTKEFRGQPSGLFLFTSGAVSFNF